MHRLFHCPTPIQVPGFFIPIHDTMTYEEMLKQARRARTRPKDEEHRLQSTCIRWFRLQYPSFAKLLFAVPNGGRRDAVTGAKLKAEGATAGVSDLLLLVPNRFYGSLCIEMKRPGGCQSKQQREWQRAVEQAGNKYVLCRSLDDFMHVVNNYLKDI